MGLPGWVPVGGNVGWKRIDIVSLQHFLDDEMTTCLRIQRPGRIWYIFVEQAIMRRTGVQ